MVTPLWLRKEVSLLEKWYTDSIMRILLAAGIYPPDIGGPATYARMIETELPSQGIEVTVIPYHVVRHIPKVFRHLAYFLRLRTAVRGCDLVYALDPISVGLPALLASRLYGKPFLLRLGGDYAWEQGSQRFGVTKTLDEYTADTTGRTFSVRVLAWLQSFVATRAALVIVPSAYLGQIVSSWGVHLERLKVIHSAPRPLVVPESRDTLRQTCNYFGEVLVSVARLTPWKGMGSLISLVALRRARGITTTLIIVGDGPQRSILETQVAELKLDGIVVFLGALTKPELGKVIKAADIFILNTAYEGLSHQLLEVMQIGTPIITTPVGGNPELITDQVEGLLVQVNDIAGYDTAVDMLMNHDDIRLACIAGAKLKIRDFNPESALLDLGEVLRQAVR